MKKEDGRLILNDRELKQLERTAKLLHKLQRTLRQDCEINTAAWLARQAIESILYRDMPNVILLDQVWQDWSPKWDDT